ncbi:UNVERIFIED_ORG: S-adenosylhomocysteine hydrolase [Microbispora rosea subsp. rosea]
MKTATDGAGQRCVLSRPVRATTVEFRGEPADVPIMCDTVLAEICKVVDIAEAGGDAAGLRLRTGGGAMIRVVAGVPAAAKAAPTATHTLTLVLEDAGDLAPDQAAAVLDAVRRLPFTPVEMDALRRQMPLTGELPLFLPANCLASVAPVLTVHHMTDFLIMVETVRALGVPAQAITVLDKGYRYQHTHRVDAHLAAQGVRVWPWTRTADALADHAQRAAAMGRSGLLIDDGGYTLPVLLTERSDLLPAYIGLVEQTISGITKLENWQRRLPVPVFSVAESALKAAVESYGIADAAIRNVLRLLPDEKMEGQPALVVGFGRIGEQLAEVLRQRRMRVAVYDRRLVRLIAAHERGFLTGRCLTTLLRDHHPFLIVGSTGRTSLRGEHAGALTRDCYLVSTTSRDREFAVAELAGEATRVEDAGVLGTRLHLPSGAVATLVADGMPVNFHHAESLPNSYADLILASLIVGAATLATPGHSFQPGHNLAETDTVLEGCGLLERYYARFGPGNGA